MSNRRRSRRLLALGSALALLAMQGAQAVLACPPEQRSATATMRVAALPRDETGDDGPALSHRRVVRTAQSGEPSKAPLPELPDIVRARSLHAPAFEGGAGRAARMARAGDETPPSDPVYLATRRLRN